MEPDEKTQLEQLTRTRKSAHAKVRRATILLMYGAGRKITQIARELKTNRPLIERCIDKALAYGPVQALDDLPRSGRPPEITDDAKSWVLSIACQRPADIGYAAEVWTYSLLIKHIKTHYQQVGHLCLSKLGKGRLNAILSKGAIKPHKVSYYLERRDPDFEEKMANLLCVYKEVAIMNVSQKKNRKSATISYDEKPGIQAIKEVAPCLLPEPGKYPTRARDYEYKRLGTVSFLCAIDLHTGRAIPLVRDRHRSKEFTDFLDILDGQYPADWKLRIILDNHSSHISKETRKYLARKPGRFKFVFTPTHGSWLNLIESFFSKIARSFLRQIRVESKQELVERIYKGIEEINQEPVVFRWKYKLSEVAAM